MKRSFLAGLLVVILALFSVGCVQDNNSSNNSNTSNNNSSLEKNRIILMNPGVYYLESLVYMTENDIINIDNLEYQAVFYTRNEVSYEEAEKYVKDNGISYISLKKIDGNLNVANLYKKNSCTDSFIKLFENSDGVIFLGGADLPAAAYNQKTSLLTAIRTPNRHLFELSFLYHLLGREDDNYIPLLEKKPDYVVYGICLGLQSMNVATGGDLYQDIPSEVYGMQYFEDVVAQDKNNVHRAYSYSLNFDNRGTFHSYHQIKFVDGQFFTENMKKDKDYHPYVVSSHHQAIKNTGKGFDVSAYSMDGKIIEAIYHNKYKNVFGTQFHPEGLNLHDPGSTKYRIEPGDTILQTEHDYINSLGSYPFQLEFWEYFSSLF